MSTAIGTVPRSEPWRWIALVAATGLVLAVAAWVGFGGGMRMPVVVTTQNDGSAAVHTVSVTGVGRVFVTPDIAVVRLGVLVQEPTVAAARDAGARAMNGAIDAVRGLGIPVADIQTSTLSLQAVYESKPEGGAPRIVGWELRNGATITVRNLDLVGPVIDGAVSGGATTIDGITFSVADPTPQERRAREAAVADARTRADTLVRAAGTSITGIVSIGESVATPSWPSRAPTPVDAGGTPVLPGTTEIDVTVSIVYAIE
jgi:uncharacterized protein YggE